VAWTLPVFPLSVLLALIAFSTQLPPSQKFSAEGKKAFTQELNRVRDLLASANDKGSVEFQIARTYAAGGQYREAMEWLPKIVSSDLGFDPSRDKLFASLGSAKEFQSLVAEVRARTLPVSNSRLVNTVPGTDLFPENLAYDPVAKTFFLGSTLKDEIVRCNQQGMCETFVAPHRDGLGYVLGLKLLSVIENALDNQQHRAGRQPAPLQPFVRRTVTKLPTLRCAPVQRSCCLREGPGICH
jgi:hypothetical protein